MTAARTPRQIDCTICGHNLAHRVLEVPDTDGATDATFTLYACDACGTGFLAPLPDQAALARRYQDEFFSKADRRGALSRLFGRFEAMLFERRVRLVGRVLGDTPGAVLDIGCGNGNFLHAMQRRGWTITGIEPSEHGAQRAGTDYGLEVINDDVFQVDLPPESFDLITLWHVLEHVPDPIAFIQRIQSWLKPAGKLLIAVPNFSGIEARLLKTRWAFLDIPRHQYQFNMNSLVVIAERSELVVDSDRMRLFEYSFPITMLNFFSILSGRDHMMIYNIVKKQHAVRPGLGVGLRMLFILLCAVICVVPLTVVNVLTELTRSTNGLIVVLRRKNRTA